MPFEYPRGVERQLERELNKVARQTGALMSMFISGEKIENTELMEEAAVSYSRAIGIWGRRVASRIVGLISRKNRKKWEEQSKLIGKELAKESAESIVGIRARQLIEEQVLLIKSMPLEAARRAQKIALEAAIGAKRPEVAALELAQTEKVTRSRAALIARTETARANAAITQARAQDIGSEEYIWRTMEDESVRPAHAALNGQVFRFDSPPEIPGEGSHGPGEFPNCRCYAEPIIK